ncbi:MAG: thiamine phosphate synthase [Lishizhenia sp.]
MNLPRIQYITHPKENFEDLSWVENLAEGGVQWIQLRIKENHFQTRFPNKNYTTFFEETALKLAEKCKAFGVILTVNDNYSFAKHPNIDGAHIGKEDENHSAVREQLGEKKILGCTANSWEDIKNYNLKEIDYLGVGPFTFTTTKDKNKLAPALGIRGYRIILSQMKNKKWDTPVFAIGGIEEEDITMIMKTGVHGIALSGLIFNKNHTIKDIKRICKAVEDGKIENR